MEWFTSDMSNKRIKVNCEYCGKEKEIFWSVYNKSKNKLFFCDRNCQRLYLKGRKHSPETIEKISIANSGEKNGRYKDGHTYKTSYCPVCGKEKDWRAKTCKSCYKPQPFLGRKHSKENLSIIGEKSKKKFQDEEFMKTWKTNHHKMMEEKGYWKPLHLQDDFWVYKALAMWKENYFNNKHVKGQKKIELYEIYNPRKNKTGLVRDHMYSINSGFDNGVFPEILRHPANCEIMLNTENSKKCRNNSISLEELLDKILYYKYDYKEQDLCLYLVAKYKDGYRYNKEFYIKKGGS